MTGARARVWIVLFTLALLGAKGTVTLSDLQERYERLEKLEALVEQTKTSPYLIKPLKSEGRFSFDGKVVLWELTKPVAQKIRITKTAIEVDGQSVALPQSGSGSVGALIFALFSGDLDHLKKFYDVDWRDLRLTLTPKKDLNRDRKQPGSTPLDSLVIEFASLDQIRMIEIKAANEVTSMIFSEVKATFGDGKAP